MHLYSSGNLTIALVPSRTPAIRHIHVCLKKAIARAPSRASTYEKSSVTFTYTVEKTDRPAAATCLDVQKTVRRVRGHVEKTIARPPSRASRYKNKTATRVRVEKHRSVVVTCFAVKKQLRRFQYSDTASLMRRDDHHANAVGSSTPVSDIWRPRRCMTGSYSDAQICPSRPSHRHSAASSY